MSEETTRGHAPPSSHLRSAGPSQRRPQNLDGLKTQPNMSENKTEDTDEREALITEICDYVLKFPTRAKGQEPSEERSHTVIIPDIETEHGNASLTYHLKAAVADFFKEFEGRLNAIRIKHTEGAVSLFNMDTKSARDTVLSSLVQHATVYMVIGLNVEIEAAINKVFQKAILYGEARTMSHAIDNTEQDTGKIDLRESISTLRKILAREKRADKHFIKVLGGIDNVYVPVGKGRPRTWTKASLDQAVRKASIKFKKDKYRPPTLSDVAAHISRLYPDRMQLNAKSLGQMLKRYELEWKDLKNPQI